MHKAEQTLFINWKALKECYETEYWLDILYKVNSLQEDVYNELNNKSGTLRRKLIASITTAKKNQSNGKQTSGI